MRKRLVCALLVTLSLSGVPQASAEVFTLPAGSRPTSNASDVRIAPEFLRGLSPEQQRIVQDRLLPAPSSATSALSPSTVASRSADLALEPPSTPPAAVLPSGSYYEKLFAQRVSDPKAAPLKQFGYELFDDAAPSFAPGDDVAVPGDYVIGPGDEVVISVQSPRRSGDYALGVNREGTLVFPNIGPIAVAGLTFDQLTHLLQRKIKGNASDMYLSVRLGKLRSIKVFVVGQVKKPGAYTLSALSHLSNAVMASGGPSKSGSLRDIQVKRRGALVGHFDYYDLLMRGDSSKDMRLQAGDIVYFPQTGPVVAIAGNVKSPGIYELKGKTTLADALKLAGNIAPMGYAQRVQIERLQGNQARKILDVDASKLEGNEALALQDGDLVTIFAISSKLTNAVYLDGNVERPGRYEYRENLRVRDIIRRTEDLKPESYMEFALIERTTPPDFHIELIPFHLGKALSGDPAENKTLSPEDKIRIYYRWDIQELPKVKIAGAINQGGEFRLRPNMTALELIHLAGGLKEQADRMNAELTRVKVEDNRIVSKRLAVNLQKVLQGDPKENVKLEKDDYLLIKPVPDYRRYRTVTLMGEFAQPGTYTFRDGETLSDVIDRAGGMTPRAYLKGAIFTRESVKQQQEARLQDFVQRLEENLYRRTAQAAANSLSSDSFNASQEALAAKKALLQSLKETKASGRMIVSLQQIRENPHSGMDVQLEEGDVLVVPPVINSVSVLGQVYNPTAITYQNGRSVGDYLSRTGGPTENADRTGIYVVKADGSVLTNQNFRRGWGPWRRGIEVAHLEPGDTIMVPERLAEDTNLRDVRDITQILFQVVSTAAITWGLMR